MFYFFHHYELPVIIQQAHLQQVLLHSRQQNAVAAAAAQQQAANGRGSLAGDNGTGGGNGGDGTGNPPPTQRPHGGNNNNLTEFIRPLMERRGDIILTTMRRFMYGMGWMAPVPIRVVNIGNLRRINLDSIQINPSNYVTPTSQSTAPSVSASATGQSNNTNTTGSGGDGGSGSTISANSKFLPKQRKKIQSDWDLLNYCYCFWAPVVMKDVNSRLPESSMGNFWNLSPRNAIATLKFDYGSHNFVLFLMSWPLFHCSPFLPGLIDQTLQENVLFSLIRLQSHMDHELF